MLGLFARQRGNILFVILIAVALFAGLSYAVTQSTRSGGNPDREARKLDQAEFDNYTANINFAVSRLTFDGCQDDELDYSPPDTWGAEDKRCHVFHPDGGAAYWRDFGDTCPDDRILNGLGIGDSCGLIVYAGELAGVRLYTTASDQGVFTWGPNGVTGATSPDDGMANTDILVGLGGHPAAEACRALGPEWYLPAYNELSILHDNRNIISGFSGMYFSSSEHSLTRGRARDFDAGTQHAWGKNSTPRAVRCVRR